MSDTYSWHEQNRDFRKALREDRMKVFYELILPQIEEEYKVVFNEAMQRYTLHGTPQGTVDVYPASNRLLIRKTNSWETGAKNWLIKNLNLET